MKGFLRERSKRWGFDGWAVRVVGAQKVLAHTVSTTREEARAARAELLKYGNHYEVVKVKITVEAIE